MLGPTGSRTRAVRFERGQLVVEVESAALLAELKSFTGDRYRRALNRELGSETVRSVTFQLKR